MSRIGKKAIQLPSGVKVDIKDNLVSVEGPKGKLEYKIPGKLKATKRDNTIVIERGTPAKEEMPLHGLARTMVFNILKGVTEGYSKNLEIKGVGFKAQVQGKELVMTLGFSHPVKYAIPEGVTVTATKPTQLVVAGSDKVKVGAAAAEIREFFKPEPYTGKGIRYVGEYVRHKAGKKVTK